MTERKISEVDAGGVPSVGASRCAAPTPSIKKIIGLMIMLCSAFNTKHMLTSFGGKMAPRTGKPRPRSSELVVNTV